MKLKEGINEYNIKEFLAQLIQENYKYIVYDYSKGDFKDIEEQFIEIQKRYNYDRKFGLHILKKYIIKRGGKSNGRKTKK